MGHGGLMAGMAQVLSGSAASLLPCKRLREAWCEEDFFVDFLCHDPAFLDVPVSPRAPS